MAETVKKVSKKVSKSEEKARKDQEWLDLCAWVEKEIFNYDSNQKLQKKACLVLKGLQVGQNIRNNNQQEYGNYSFEVILYTFKANKLKIQNAIRGKEFKDESSKMSYVAAIIRDGINDMYMRLQSAKKVEEKIEQVDTSVMEYEGAEYKPKEEKKINKRLEGLW